ncbi:MAG TPA: GNAT family N-acetyltransferase, partial [Candidatus Obscuribacterales bacterium]
VVSDNAFIRSLFAAALPLYSELMPESFAANLENMDILTEKGLDFNATGLDGWIIETEAGPVGFAGIGPLNPRQAYMAALYFLPTQRRRGFGSQALGRLEAHYQNQGFGEILLLVHQRADWARNFYTREGYRLLAEDAMAMLAHAGERLLHLIEPDLVLMGKDLPSANAVVCEDGIVSQAGDNTGAKG